MYDQSVKQLRKDARHADMIAAAFALFIERGFTATRLEDVATKAGVAKGTVVVHFPSKEALFVAVIQHYLEPAIAQVESAAAAGGSLRERLIAIVRLIHTSLADPHVGGIPKLIIAEVGNFPDLARGFHEQVCQRSRAAVNSLLQQGMAAGEFRRVDPELAGRLLLDPVVMHAIWRHSLARYDPCPVDSQAFLDTHLDLFLRGLAAGA